MKKFAVLGATGRTGEQLLQQALDQGHEVIALCRNPAKLTIQHDKFQAVEADVYSADSMIPHFKGCDAVFSCLGADSGLMKTTTFYSDTMAAITEAMRKADVQRLICMASWYTNYRKGDGGPFAQEWIFKPIAGLILGRILTSMSLMESFLIKDCQDINFTIVRPPGLGDTQVTDKEFMTEECQYVRSPCATQMARADVARFMLSAFDTSLYDKKAIAISLA
ncbi:flavin reductase (NADPH)-like [Asterias amurensis]|uniref:flavin reductase (NADPH)-like n=1 Tax=Asterias amurensis TaxID=7602 RepID=UPI003AB523B3